ncbi:hypothetical protein, partial [Burkholderia thailandensis]|uniref:hypothetical protein n=1 Tax=Burkholderia thailandensis TaxID=57975 RepID=UPI001C100E2F
MRLPVRTGAELLSGSVEEQRELPLLHVAVPLLVELQVGIGLVVAVLSLSECLCVRHKLMAKEPLYATQTQG